MLKKQVHVGESDAAEVVGKEKTVAIDKTEQLDEEETESLVKEEIASQEYVDNESEPYGMEDIVESVPEGVIPSKVTVEEFFADHDAGGIDLSYPENLEYEKSPECYPRSYYTLSGKERLLLLFAENFRQQFHDVYPDRRPLVLAIKNECDVQKLVCTTIRPTAFLFESLISNLEGCAGFVADFIKYETLERPYALPTRLVSPSTLIRRRHGNSFEMATLLCSMLIGAGFPAMVVSGSARSTTVNNDQRHVDYPLPIDDYSDLNYDDNKNENTLSSDRYKLRPKPVLVSYLTEKLAQLKIENEAREEMEREKAAQEERDAQEDDFWFNSPQRLSHAWIAIINNAPWSVKPHTKILNEDGDEIDAPPTVTFVEPATGFVHEASTRAYSHIESVWNNCNYYINLQKGRISEMRWDLRDTNDWEHFLAGEPPEMRIIEELSDENLTEETNKISVEKHLDMSRSWVQKLNLTDKEFDERLPGKQKTIHFNKVVYERFSSHSQVDGKMRQLTHFSDNNYGVPVMRWTWYDNRADMLDKLKFDYSTGHTEESFLRGRPDSLRFFIRNTDEKKPKIMHFYSSPRLDALLCCEVHGARIILHFEKSPGMCFFTEYVAKSDMTATKEITEKFHRNPSIPANKDIAVRSFLIAQNKIILKFHYNRGALTAATREFIKPPKPDFGLDIIFNPALTKESKFDNSDDPSQLELYLLLLEQLKAEERVKKGFFKRIEEIHDIFQLRKYEIKHPVLTFKCFDSLRNSGARQQRLAKEELEEQIKNQRKEQPPDYLAPYLIPYTGRELTYKESWKAYNACLDELKSRFVALLNELQVRYEDLTAESLSLKKFLNKFQDKFDNFNYDRLQTEARDLELNKRMVQKRLTITHAEAQRKYDMLKQSLLHDARLNLKKT